MSASTAVACRYAAIFLTEASRQELVRAYPPVHGAVKADHATIAYRPSAAVVDAVAASVGAVVRLRCGASRSDDAAQAVACEVVGSDAFPAVGWTGHVTISHGVGAKAARARDLALPSGGDLELEGVVGFLLEDGRVATHDRTLRARPLGESAPVKHANVPRGTTPRVDDRAARNETSRKCPAASIDVDGDALAAATTLYLWDFDGTLARVAAATTNPDDPASLDDACLPGPALAALHEAASEPGSAHVLLTGRVEACADGVKRLLARFRALDLFHGFCFKRAGDATRDHKHAAARACLSRAPLVERCVCHDDDDGARTAVHAAAFGAGVACRTVDPLKLAARGPPPERFVAFGRGPRSGLDDRSGSLVLADLRKALDAGETLAVHGSGALGPRSDGDVVVAGVSGDEIASCSARSSRPRRRTSSGPTSSSSPSPTRRAASWRSRRPSRSPARACGRSDRACV